jgi:hypothetical protein
VYGLEILTVTAIKTRFCGRNQMGIWLIIAKIEPSKIDQAGKLCAEEDAQHLPMNAVGRLLLTCFQLATLIALTVVAHAATVQQHHFIYARGGYVISHLRAGSFATHSRALAPSALLH